jgi:hypothetical protein
MPIINIIEIAEILELRIVYVLGMCKIYRHEIRKTLHRSGLWSYMSHIKWRLQIVFPKSVGAVTREMQE